MSKFDEEDYESTLKILLEQVEKKGAYFILTANELVWFRISKDVRLKKYNVSIKKLKEIELNGITLYGHYMIEVSKK